MRLLLDTCALIWWLFDDDKLGAPAAKLIEDTGTDCRVSIVSLWEIAIKRRLGRLNLPVAVLDENIRLSGWRILPLQPTHLHVLETLPTYHRDPFDHLLISQAIAEQLTMMTGDRQIEAYPVQCVAC